MPELVGETASSGSETRMDQRAYGRYHAYLLICSP
jgi:hypothetical protein